MFCPMVLQVGLIAEQSNFALKKINSCIDRMESLLIDFSEFDVYKIYQVIGKPWEL